MDSKSGWTESYLEYTDMPIPIDTLEYYHLGNLNYRSFVVDALCAAYYANSMPERADAIYRIILNSRQNNITLEMVMQRGGGASGNRRVHAAVDFLSGTACNRDRREAAGGSAGIGQRSWATFGKMPAYTMHSTRNCMNSIS